MSEIPEDVLKHADHLARVILSHIDCDSTRELIARAIAEEREKCARIAEAYADEQNKTVLASAVARAIRNPDA